MQQQAHIPAYPAYTFTKEGRFFYKGQPKKLLCKPGKSLKIKFKHNNIIREFGVAKLLAEAFIPNPHNYARIIFKDRNHHNCALDNIQWVSNSEFVRHSRNPGRPMQPKPQRPLLPGDGPPADTTAKEIPGLPGYYINPLGQVYCQGKLRRLVAKKGRPLTLLVCYNYTRKEFVVSLLLARTFLPNPNNYKHLVYKDSDKENCSLDNLQWISGREYVRRNLFPGKSMDIQSPLRKPKIPAPSSVLPPDDTAVEIPGWPGYYITPQGKVYHHYNLIRSHSKGNKSPVVNLFNKGKAKQFGLARLIATVFILNPRCYKRIIFKDRNNKNCTSENIQWVSSRDYFHYSETFKINTTFKAGIEEYNPLAKPIPGFDGYCITPDGKLYHENYRMHPPKPTGRRSPRVRIKNKEGKTICIVVAKLVALAFISNPDNHQWVIFKDRNLLNCTATNLQWVNRSQYTSFTSGAVENADLLGEIKPKKKRIPDWIDPDRVEINCAAGYYITRRGVVYHGDRIIKATSRRGEAPLIRLTIGGVKKFFGLATLVAEHFIPNPWKHKRIIFKDRDNRNCCASNIAWVDQETFTYYCTKHKGGKKLVIDRDEAIQKCTDPNLKMYYKTLDEYWLHECWKEIERDIQVMGWKQFRAECYIYFLDRAQRFSILKKPVGLMAIHVRALKEQLRKEISPDIPAAVLRSTDESLRDMKINRRKEHVEYYSGW